jgi:hypothetical protein
MKRALRLCVLSRTGCLLVASLGLSCRGVSGLLSRREADGRHPDTAGARRLPLSRVHIGLAFWGGRGCHGRPTASGEIYDRSQRTAVHRTAPLGLPAVITNWEHGHMIRAGSARVSRMGPSRLHQQSQC